MVGWINDHILVLSGWAAIAVVFLLPALESSIFLGFVIPGETAVVIGGVLAYQGKVALAGVLIAAMLGAIIGDSIGFEVGRKWGDALLGRIPARLVKPVHVLEGKEMINRLGGRAVFAGRWVSVLRALVPGLCGTSQMQYRTFLLWNAIGGVTWATGYTLLGYLAGSAWERVEHYSSVASYVLLGVFIVIIVAVALLHRRRQATKDAATEAAMSTDGGEGEMDRADNQEPAGEAESHAVVEADRAAQTVASAETVDAIAEPADATEAATRSE
jgi:membrane protein DedA with SNARE-associated domain